MRYVLDCSNGLKFGVMAVALVLSGTIWALNFRSPKSPSAAEILADTDFGEPVLASLTAPLDRDELAPPVVKKAEPPPIPPAERARMELEKAGVAFDGASFIRAISERNSDQVKLFYEAGIDVNAPGPDGRTALLTAVEMNSPSTVSDLLSRGADPNRGDDRGFTPLMAAALANQTTLLSELLERGASVAVKDLDGHTALHFAVMGKARQSLAQLIETGSTLSESCCGGEKDVCTHAFETKHWKIVEPILSRVSNGRSWSTPAKEFFVDAFNRRDATRAKLLIEKHSSSPTPPDRRQPWLAYSALAGDTNPVRFLLECGDNPDAKLDPSVEPEFLRLVPKGFLKHYLETEPGMTVLMLAAGLGHTEIVRTLLDHGANRGIGTQKWKLPALVFAAKSGKAETAQALIKGSPEPSKLRIEISLSAQTATLIKNGVSALTTSISSGRPGYATPVGEYVVTDKRRHHVSSIYKVKMPYFLRLSCQDFGMHAGYLPGYPASHGCIRLPEDVAAELFRSVPIGTLVSIRP